MELRVLVGWPKIGALAWTFWMTLGHPKSPCNKRGSGVRVRDTLCEKDLKTHGWFGRQRWEQLSKDCRRSWGRQQKIPSWNL